MADFTKEDDHNILAARDMITMHAPTVDKRALSSSEAEILTVDGWNIPGFHCHPDLAEHARELLVDMAITTHPEIIDVSGYWWFIREE